MENGENNNLVQTTPVQEVNTEVQTVPATEVQTVPVTEPVSVSTQPVKSEPQVIVQAINTEANKQKKKLDKKTIIRIAAVGVILLGVVVYLVFFHNWEPKEDPSDPKSVVTVFFNSIINKDYTKAFKYTYLPENSFVNEDDFFSFISGDKYLGDLPNRKIKEVLKETKEHSSATYKVTLNNDKEYSMNLKMNSSGDWFVVVDNLYIENWKIEVPGDSKFYIDNKLVSSSISKKDNGHDIYTIPAIAPSKKEFKIETTLDTYTTKFEVAGSNSGEKIIPEFTKEEEINKYLEGLKDLWNNLYKDYLNSKSKEEVSKYFDSSIKSEDIEKYYTKSFDTLTRKGNKNSTYKNVVLDSIIVNPDKKCYIEGNDTLKLEFGYKITFLEDFVYKDSTDLNRAMTRYSSIKLKKDKDEYKISEVTDEKLFNFLKYTVNEY